jgi:hypothetical protein
MGCIVLHLRRRRTGCVSEESVRGASRCNGSGWGCRRRIPRAVRASVGVGVIVIVYKCRVLLLSMMLLYWYLRIHVDIVLHLEQRQFDSEGSAAAQT